MKKAVIFGGGKNYHKLKKHIPVFFNVEIIAIVDNSITIQGSSVDGFNVIPPKKLNYIEYDVIIVTPIKPKEIISQLNEMGVSAEKIEIIPQELQYCVEIESYIEFENKQILEVGCGNGSLLKAIAKIYNPEFITGIDPSLSQWWGVGESKGDNWCIIDGNVEALEFDNNKFDAVISIVAFEHIKDIDKALQEIKRVLKPSGRFYATVSPPWTSVVGHHFASDKWNPQNVPLIPPWGHLYMTEDEIREHAIKEGANHNLANELVDFIFHSDIINRISRFDFICNIVNSGMTICNFNEHMAFSRYWWNDYQPMENELTQEILDNISKTKYKPTDLGVLAFTVVLEKYADF